MEETNQMTSRWSACNTKVRINKQIHKNISNLAQMEAKRIELQQKQS